MIASVLALIDAGVSTPEIALHTGIAAHEIDVLRARIDPPKPSAPTLTLRQQLLVALAHHRPSYRDDSDLLFAVDQLIDQERESAP